MYSCIWFSDVWIFNSAYQCTYWVDIVFKITSDHFFVNIISRNRLTIYWFLLLNHIWYCHMNSDDTQHLRCSWAMLSWLSCNKASVSLYVCFTIENNELFIDMCEPARNELTSLRTHYHTRRIWLDFLTSYCVKRIWLRGDWGESGSVIMSIFSLFDAQNSSIIVKQKAIWLLIIIIWPVLFLYQMNDLLSYFGAEARIFRSIPWLLMSWLLASPGHHRPWYWLCWANGPLYFMKKGFSPLRHVSVEKW